MKNLWSILKGLVAIIAVGWYLIFWITRPHMGVVYSIDGLTAAYKCGWSNIDCTIEQAQLKENPSLCGMLLSAEEDLCYESVISSLSHAENCKAIAMEHYRQSCTAAFAKRNKL